MNTKMFRAFFHQLFIGFHHLGPCHAVLGIPGVIHNAVGNSKMPAGVKTAADRFGNPCNFFQKIHMGQVVQVDDDSHLFSQLHVFHRRFVRTEHYIGPCKAHSMAHFQFRQGRAVCPAAFFFQDLQDVRVRRGFHGKIFFEPFVPAECPVYQTGRPADSRLVVQVKGRRKVFGNLFCFFFCYVRNFFTHVSYFSFYNVRFTETVCSQ